MSEPTKAMIDAVEDLIPWSPGTESRVGFPSPKLIVEAVLGALEAIDLPNILAELDDFKFGKGSYFEAMRAARDEIASLSARLERAEGALKEIGAARDLDSASGEMVERVARAICSANGDDPDYQDTPGLSEWLKYKVDARAAIAALTPTQDVGNAPPQPQD